MNNICPICNQEIWAVKNKHHVFNGAYKKKSEEDNFIKILHPLCHRKLHDTPSIERALKEECQKEYEQTHTREEFIKRYGKSYL